MEAGTVDGGEEGTVGGAERGNGIQSTGGGSTLERRGHGQFISVHRSLRFECWWRS